MRLEFIGAAHEVTGSCHFLNVDGKNIIVDHGMEQGMDIYENVPLPVDPAAIDYILVTHAHIDHSGMIPRLYVLGFRGQIYATKATTELCSIMLRDSAHIQMMEAEWKNRKSKRTSDSELIEPAYSVQDVDQVMKLFVPCEYGEIIEIEDCLKIRFSDVGHLLGSSAIEVWLKEDNISKKIVFSGDIGNKNKPILKDPSHVSEADYVLIESTYGDRLHPKDELDYVSILAGILQETFDKGGNVVIPAFAVGRTQEVLYIIREIKTRNLVKGHDGFKVFLDSPLAIEATNVFNKNIMECYDDEALEIIKSGVNPITFKDLCYSISSVESKAINDDESPKVIIAAAGMCDAGRIRHHLKHNLWREESTVLFVGYQAIGTPGRSILDGAEEVKLFGESIAVKARICSLPGASGHADRDGLVDWLRGIANKPEKVFVVHGEDNVTDIFAEYLKNEFGYDTMAPFSGTIFDLIKGEVIEATEGRRITHKKKSRVSAVFERLLAAGQRLMVVISHNEGGANKDLAKFADQINALCDKWDR